MNEPKGPSLFLMAAVGSVAGFFLTMILSAITIRSHPAFSDRAFDAVGWLMGTAIVCFLIEIVRWYLRGGEL